MSVIIVIGTVLLATFGVNMFAGRRRGDDDALDRHERALAALREVAEHPHPLVADPHRELPPTDHIRILREPPADAAARRRRARRTAAARRAADLRNHPRDIADRPTAAHLPTRPGGERPPNRELKKIELPAIDDPLPAMAALEIEPTHLREPRPSRSRDRRRLSTRVRVAAIGTTAGAAILATVVALAPASGARKERAVKVVTAPTTTTRPAPATTTPQTTPPSAHLAATPGVSSGTVVVAVPFTLTMSTSAPCWVSVQTNTGQTVFEGTLQAGQHQDVSGTGPLTIRLGNTAAMQMTLNGAPLDLAGMARTANVQFNPA